jgi:EAL and modified HD-GYP domain-containing signal transduction protein
MQNQSVLENILIGYTPVIDAQRTLTATRLTVFPERGARVDAPQLLNQLTQTFGLGAPGSETQGPSVLLNIADEDLLDQALAAAQREPTALLIEVPAFMAADPRRTPVLQAMREGGQMLAMSGRPVTELPREVLPSFRHAIVDFHDDRRLEAVGPETPMRRITTLSSGIRLDAEIDTAFKRGVVGVIGWPMDDEAPHAGNGSVPPEVRGIVDLMNRVEREEPVERMEPVLTADPSLAFRLLRYLNSSAFGLRSEVTSFKHALMLLGHQRLKRWLALLLASGSKNVASRPLMIVAARRGLIMEELARGMGDEAMRSEMFICGVFSLLDHLMRQPFEELLKNVPVQQGVQASLLGTGPYTQHLALVQAIEQSSIFDMREAADRVLIARSELNRALLKALSVARELD